MITHGIAPTLGVESLCPIRQSDSTDPPKGWSFAMTSTETRISIREAVKYYFADFVRKWDTPPSPFHGCLFWQKRSYGFGGYPPPAVYGFSPENFSSKRAKNCVFCSKNT